jgi:hypothetical protein
MIRVRHRSHATHSRQPRQVRKEATVTGSCVCSGSPVPGLFFACHPEQAFFAPPRVWASRSKRHRFCEVSIARVWLASLSHTQLHPLSEPKIYTSLQLFAQETPRCVISLVRGNKNFNTGPSLRTCAIFQQNSFRQVLRFASPARSLKVIWLILTNSFPPPSSARYGLCSTWLIWKNWTTKPLYIWQAVRADISASSPARPLFASGCSMKKNFMPLRSTTSPTHPQLD